MEQYFEQSVSGYKRTANRMVYALSWLAIVLLMLLAVIFAANILTEQAETVSIRWLNAIAMAVCLVFAGIIFRCKDRLHMEYDYIFKNGNLEIWGILNRRRRRMLANINLQRVSAWGAMDGCTDEVLRHFPGCRVHKWYCRNGNYYICYKYKEERVCHVIVLEGSEELAALIDKNVPVGARQCFN